jgi:hypothetical protein
MLDTVLRNPGRSFATIYFPLVYVLPPFERTELLLPNLRFRVFLGGDGANELEVVR